MRTKVAMKDINTKTDSLAVPGINVSFKVVDKTTGDDGRITLVMQDGVEIDGLPDREFWVDRSK